MEGYEGQNVLLNTNRVYFEGRQRGCGTHTKLPSSAPPARPPARPPAARESFQPGGTHKKIDTPITTSLSRLPQEYPAIAHASSYL